MSFFVFAVTFATIKDKVSLDTYFIVLAILIAAGLIWEKLEKDQGGLK